MDGVRLLCDLVATPSPTGDTARAVDRLVQAMREARFDEAYVDGAGNAVGVAGTGAREVLLVGHVDTVPGDLPVRVEDGVLWGRGSVDAKGPLAAFAAAAAHFVGHPDVRVVVVGCVDEETESAGARHLIDRWRPEALVIGEPSGTDGVTLGYKGIAKIRYALEADVAHTGAPFPTVSDRAVAFWAAAQAWLAPRHGPTLFDTPTLKLASIQSSVGRDGRERVDLHGSARLPPGFDVDSFLDFLRARAGPAELRVPEISAAWVGDKRSAVARAFVAAVREERRVPRYVRKTGTSDANLLAPAWGVPCVAYGPGDSSLDHTPQERISLADFAAGVRVVRGALGKLAGSPPETSPLAPPVSVRPSRNP